MGYYVENRFVAISDPLGNMALIALMMKKFD